MTEPHLAPDHYSDDQLRHLLQGCGEGDLERDALQHLEECPACRQRLEALASDAAMWQKVARVLEESELEEDPLTAEFDSQDFSLEIDAQPEPLAYRQKAVIAAVQPLLNPSDDPRMLGRLGRFEIVGVIGSGGMGIVLKASDPSLARYVAIKILAPHLASTLTARQRFAREARAAAAVLHDNVIAIYQVEPDSDPPFLVMPYLPGPSLQQRLVHDGPLEVESVLSIGLQIARGLQAAHHQGLVHRDVKPANVLLASGTNRAVITDFGLARATDDASITREGTLAGTPHYMSPEQARGEAVDSRSDVFSLGSVLFAMLTGSPPVPLEGGEETIRKIARTPMPRLQEIAELTPEWLSRLVERMHASDAEERMTIDEAVASLQACLAHLRDPQQHPLPASLVAPAPGKNRRKRPLATLAITIVLVALIVPLAVSRSPWGIAAPDPSTASTTHSRSKDASDSEGPSDFEDPSAQPLSTGQSPPTPMPTSPPREVEASTRARERAEPFVNGPAPAQPAQSTRLLEQIDREINSIEATLQRIEGNDAVESFYLEP